MAETNAGSSSAAAKIVVPKDELHAFCVRSFEKGGAKTGHASALADLMVAADCRGTFSHGMSRLDFYMNQILTNKIALDKEPEIVKQTVATALVDGNNVVGPVVGRFAMDLAIRKAKEAGIGWVTVKGSNHFGIAAWYAMQASEQGLLGLAFTNTSPKMVPTRARKETLGTNPICVAAPANNGDGMVLDMATTGVAFGKVRLKTMLNESVPLGWGVDSQGKPTTDSRSIFESGGLMPLGGPEETSGYKGYGLGMMVEVFCGILSGAAFGPFIAHWALRDGPADVSHCFVAIDPEAFAPGFPDRMSQLLDHCRNLEPAEGETEVLVPGDPERQHMAMCDKLGGIPYKPKQIQVADEFAAKHGIEPLKRKS
ncbi:hypothetical protein BaRGS_00000053 [Batillaria attramentaria]|uniref:Malate dehydrogenase n=1 Tax=Batillaria attramentaria TaxID=370345 RepID=A0ABD0M9Q0_9CAEN